MRRGLGRERQNGCGWRGGQQGEIVIEGKVRETAGECDEAWRKKTVNEVFLEA